jgi:ketosteroid isomerase-like protein
MQQPRVDRFIDALHSLEVDNDLERMVSLYSNRAAISNPVTRHELWGQEGAREFWSAYRRTFEEIHSDFRNVVEGDGTAVLEWTSRGRAADGREIRYSGVSVLEFEGDRIGSFRAYFDSRELASQLLDPGGGPRD